MKKKTLVQLESCTLGGDETKKTLTASVTLTFNALGSHKIKWILVMIFKISISPFIYKNVLALGMYVKVAWCDLHMNYDTLLLSIQILFSVL